MASQPVVLYSATGCPLCGKYKTLLDSKGVRFEERDTTVQPALLNELAAKGIRQVPTIFVGDKHVAGFRPAAVLELLAA
jgi:glutaredoxin